MQSWFGPYRLDGLLGRGGMGDVFRAFDTEHNRVVALKLLPEHLSADADFRARFRQEAETVATLRDPHVVPIHRYGEIDGRLYLDMRLVDGEDLGAVLAREGPLDPARAVAVVEQVAAALDSAHDDGLVHRDVKPSNVLLTEPRAGLPEFVYLVDFGLARSVTAHAMSLTGTGQAIGTLAYMAPERFADAPVDRRTDIYALTCVLYECLTGRKPFDGESTASVVHGHLQRMPPRPSERREGLPPELDSVVVRGMAKRPDDRFPRASDLAAAARAALTGARPAPHAPHPPAPRSPLDGARSPGTSPQRPRTGVHAVPHPTASARMPMTPPPMPVPMPAAPMAPTNGSSPPRSAPPRTLVTPLPLPVPRPAPLADPAVPGVAVVGPPAPGDAAPARRRPLPRRAGWVVVALLAVVALVGAFLLLPSGGAAPVAERTVVVGENVVRAVALAQLGGRAVLAASGDDRATVVADALTGERVGEPRTGHEDDVYALAAGTVEGRTVVVTGSDDHTARITDLAGAAPDGVLTAHSDDVNAVAVGDLDGRPVAVTGSNDRSVGVWNLADGTPVSFFPTAHTQFLRAVLLARVGDRAVVVTASNDGTVRQWNPADGTAAADPYTGHTAEVRALAAGVLDGRTVLASAGYDDTVRVWDPATGGTLSSIDVGTDVHGVAFAEVDGNLVVVSAAEDSAVRLSDPRTGEVLAPALTGHRGAVQAVATGTVDGRPVAVTGGDDGTARVWDLAARLAG